MEKIYSIYKKEAHENLNELINLLEDLNLAKAEEEKLKEILSNIIFISCETVINKWKKKQKSCRTEILLTIFDYLKEDNIKISLNIDAMINIFDDLYDENLGKEEKSLMLIELMRLFVNLFKTKTTEKEVALVNSMKKYFLYIIIIGISEMFYASMLESASQEEELKILKTIYKIRSLDIDIFIEFPSLLFLRERRIIEQLIRLGRTFRAIQLMRKDLIDINHDLLNEINSPLTVLKKKYADVNQIAKILIRLVSTFREEGEKILKETAEREYFDIFLKLHNKIKEEEHKLKKSISEVLKIENA